MYPELTSSDASDRDQSSKPRVADEQTKRRRVHENRVNKLKQDLERGGAVKQVYFV